jgi:hypothetical protein
MTTTKITLQGNETLDQLREIARQLFKQARAERKLRQAGDGFFSPERYKLVCPACGRLWTDDHTC